MSATTPKLTILENLPQTSVSSPKLKPHKIKRCLSNLSTDTEFSSCSPTKERVFDRKKVKINTKIDVVFVESFKKYNEDVSQKKKGYSWGEVQVMKKKEETVGICVVF